MIRFRFVLLVFSVCCLNLLMTQNPLIAQWSTSTIAESTLYVCPGFYPGIVTFDDGSSIILGALQSYIYAQKLDEYGYKQWTTPVQVFHNDSSYITETPNGDEIWGGWITDGVGGVIVFWYDHRGAYFDQTSWANNAIYAQHVDKFGNLLWGNGVKIEGPETGLKRGDIVNDGQGGCVIAMAESEFDFPGASNKERTRIVRVSNSGQILWDKALDSNNIHYSVYYVIAKRAIDRLYVTSPFGARISLFDGTQITDSALSGFGLLTSEKDSVLYNVKNINSNTILQTKFTYTLDTIWTATSSGGSGSVSIIHNSAVPDGAGGIYYLRTREDSSLYAKVRRVDNRGEVWENELIVTNTDIPTGGTDGHGGIMVGGQWPPRVWRFDSLKNPVWNNPVHILNSQADAYFPIFSSDNNGGMIMTYWTTNGGIYTQHSGRYGQVGVITNVHELNNVPTNIILNQNYPNPFNPETVIKYSIPRKEFVSIKIFDVTGREINSLVNTIQEAGTYIVKWNAINIPSGVYFYQLTTPSFTQTKKLLLLK